MKDERILKKVDKLLKLYGVEDDEREKFLLDLKDKKYDDQEELEEVSEDDTVEEVDEVEQPEQVEQPVEEDLPTEEGEVEEQPAEPVGEEVEQEEVGEVAEEVEQPELPADESVDQPMEEPLEEQPMEQPMEQPQPANEDVNKTIEGLMARVESLEDIIKKLGTPVDEESVGVEPRNPSGESYKESEMDRINRLRMGR